MNTDYIMNKIKELEELESRRKNTIYFIEKYISIESNNDRESLENEPIIKNLKSQLKETNRLIAEYGKEKITISLGDLINNLSVNNKSISLIPNIYINVIPKLGGNLNKLEEDMRNSIISKFNISVYEFDDSIINLNLFFNEDVASLNNVINAKVDIISDNIYDIGSYRLSNCVPLIFYCNYGDDIIMKYVKPENLTLTFDISELLSLNSVIKEAVMNCLNRNSKVKKINI